MKNQDTSMRADRLAHWKKYGDTLPQQVIDEWADYASTLTHRQIVNLYLGLKRWAAPQAVIEPADPPEGFRLAKPSDAAYQIDRYWQEQNSPAAKKHRAEMKAFTDAHPVKPWPSYYDSPEYKRINLKYDRQDWREIASAYTVLSVGALVTILAASLAGSVGLVVIASAVMGLTLSVAVFYVARVITNREKE